MKNCNEITSTETFSTQYEYVIAFLKNAKNAIDNVDWLKSLKQRIGE